MPITDTPKRIPITLSDTHYRHTQEDTHLHRVIPWHWVIPIPWVIFPLTESSHNPPKSLPMTLRDLGFLTNKPDTEWYPLHWGIPLTLSYAHYPEFQPIGYRTDGRTSFIIQFVTKIIQKEVICHSSFIKDECTNRHHVCNYI